MSASNPQARAGSEARSAAEVAALTTLPYESSEVRSLSVNSFGITDQGRQRRANEDQFLIAILTKALGVRQSSLAQQSVQYSEDQAHLFIVADGMGGHRGGAQASALAVLTIETFLLNAIKWLFTLDANGTEDVLAEFQEALRRADARICEEASRHPELRGMGAVLTMAFSFRSELFVAHVGDSRCYLWRGGRLLRMTHDHTLVQQLIDHGAFRSEEDAPQQFRHIVTNAVGGPQPGVLPEVHKTHLESGDVLMLCTDGLTGMVPEDRIAAVLRETHEPARACEELVRLANEQGGSDNVTVVVAQYAMPH